MCAKTKGKSKAAEKIDGSWAELTEELLGRIADDDLGSWKREWAMLEPARNPVTGSFYSGGNLALLYHAMIERQTSDPRFCGFDQAKKQGWAVKKGATGIPIARFCQTLYDEAGKRVPGQSKMSAAEKRAYVQEHEGSKLVNSTKALYVFSLAEMDGPKPFARENRKMADMPVIDSLISHSPCPVQEVPSDGACYIPALDCINMPVREQFKDLEGLASTLLHEQVHSTGHPSRLNREIRNKFGSEAYAREELVAELGSAMAYSRLGLAYPELEGGASDQGLDNRAAYLKSWASNLEDPVDAIKTVFGDASRAAAMIVAEHERDREREPEHGAIEQEATRDVVVPDEADEAVGLESLEAVARGAAVPGGGAGASREEVTR